MPSEVHGSGGLESIGGPRWLEGTLNKFIKVFFYVISKTELIRFLTGGL